MDYLGQVLIGIREHKDHIEGCLLINLLQVLEQARQTFIFQPPDKVSSSLFQLRGAHVLLMAVECFFEEGCENFELLIARRICVLNHCS